MTPTQGFVYVVDDDASFRRSVSRLLSTVGYEVAVFSSGTAFFAQHSARSRGCVLADLHMPGCNGLELQSQLITSGNPLPVVFISGNGTIPSTVKAMRNGAVDFLTKCAPENELLAAIAQALLQDKTQHARRRTIEKMQAFYHQLSAREREVFARVITGDLNKQIADDLGIALRTVKLHRTNISRKLGMPSVPEWIQVWNMIRDGEI
jgi:FixJ family two-component response regulator